MKLIVFAVAQNTELARFISPCLSVHDFRDSTGRIILWFQENQILIYLNDVEEFRAILTELDESLPFAELQSAAVLYGHCDVEQLDDAFEAKLVRIFFSSFLYQRKLLTEFLDYGTFVA